MRKVLVNPRVVDKSPLLVEDDLGRVIPFRKGGTEMNLTTHISRQIKAGDLEWLDKPKPKEETGKGKAGKKKEG